MNLDQIPTSGGISAFGYKAIFLILSVNYKRDGMLITTSDIAGKLQRSGKAVNISGTIM